MRPLRFLGLTPNFLLSELCVLCGEARIFALEHRTSNFERYSSAPALTSAWYNLRDELCRAFDGSARSEGKARFLDAKCA
jgi:hypothetical protein